MPAAASFPPRKAVFPHALEAGKAGYNAFALIYRPDTPYEDLGAAIEYIKDHAEELQVDPENYSLWGGSAGARMAATLGNADYLCQLTGRSDLPQAAAVIMQYTGYNIVSAADAPTYANVGTSDGIAGWRTMQARLESLESLGIPTEFHSYQGLGHGFGLGTGTVAEGWIQDTAKERVRWAVGRSLQHLQTGYIDLFLIHQPYGSYSEAWMVLEELVKEGCIRNIGVCNFPESKLEELLQIGSIRPAVNQIELHPYFLHSELTSFMEKHQIIPMAWGSLCEGMRDIFHNPAIAGIGVKYQKTAAQVILRWHLQRNIPALFKTVNEDHLREDTSIHDFALTKEEMVLISSLDMGYSEIVDYENPQTEKWLTGWDIYQAADQEAEKKWNNGRLAMA